MLSKGGELYGKIDGIKREYINQGILADNMETIPEDIYDKYIKRETENKGGKPLSSKRRKTNKRKSKKGGKSKKQRK